VLSASILVAASAAFLAGVLSGFADFGHAAIVVPLLLLVYEPKTVVTLAGALFVCADKPIRTQPRASFE